MLYLEGVSLLDSHRVSLSNDRDYIHYVMQLLHTTEVMLFEEYYPAYHSLLTTNVTYLLG